MQGAGIRVERAWRIGGSSAHFRSPSAPLTTCPKRERESHAVSIQECRHDTVKLLDPLALTQRSIQHLPEDRERENHVV